MSGDIKSTKKITESWILAVRMLKILQPQLLVTHRYVKLQGRRCIISPLLNPTTHQSTSIIIFMTPVICCHKNEDMTISMFIGSNLAKVSLTEVGEISEQHVVIPCLEVHPKKDHIIDRSSQ